MLLKSRKESEELLVFRSLYSRMRLSEKVMNHWINLEKGFAGEVLFDQ